MAYKKEREYRNFANFELRAIKDDAETENDYIVEGYAALFNAPYELFEYEGTTYNEDISDKAFDSADMSDIVFLYNHEGMVHARLRNGTLKVMPDEKGLRVWADLSSTNMSRDLYQAIKTGLVCQMSWAFTVEEDDYNKDTHTRTIKRVKKVYDCSAVSIPANPATEISARSYVDGVIAKEQAERLEAEKRAEKIKRIKILTEV